jgi:hypothetical protein
MAVYPVTYLDEAVTLLVLLGNRLALAAPSQRRGRNQAQGHKACAQRQDTRST